ERGGADDGRARRRGGHRGAGRAEERQRGEEAPAPEPVAGERRDHRGARRTGEPGAHDEPHLGGPDPEPPEVAAEQDADPPGPEGTQEGGGVEDAAIAGAAQPRAPSLAFSDA